jgi:AcrR family transcriptional regulator
MVSSVADPARSRKRPRDRKKQIAAAAAELFWERGYRQVSMADVAAAVEIGASALYRHFSGKSDLLVAVLGEGLGRLEAAAAGPESGAGAQDRAVVLTALAAATIEGREYAALWDRAAAELAPDAARDLRARRDRVLQRIAATVPAGPSGGPSGGSAGSPCSSTSDRPSGDPGATRLRARAALAVLQSPSHHRVDLRGESAVRLLSGAADACLTVALPDAGPARPTSSDAGAGGMPSGVLLPRARSEALLAVAGRMFAERGYHAVSLGEIGEAAGIAGPSIYKHFPSKIDLLLAILSRGNQALWFALHQSLAEASGPQDALGRLLSSYVGVVGASPGAVSMLLSELATLPAPQRAEYRATQRRYVAEWVGLLRDWRPELSEPAALVLTHAAFAVTNALAHPDPIGGDPSAVPLERIHALSRTVLGLAPPERGY